jgi:hypothetical protein
MSATSPTQLSYGVFVSDGPAVNGQVSHGHGQCRSRGSAVPFWGCRVAMPWHIHRMPVGRGGHQGRTFGAPRPAAKPRLASWREKPGRMSGRDGPDGAARSAGSRRSGAAASLASFGRWPYGRGGCRARRPRHRPQPVPAVTSPVPRQASRTRPPRSRQVRRSPGGSHSRWAGTPRIVRVGPSTRSLCQHGGPDGEGQARGQAQRRAANLPL